MGCASLIRLWISEETDVQIAYMRLTKGVVQKKVRGLGFSIRCRELPRRLLESVWLVLNPKP